MCIRDRIKSLSGGDGFTESEGDSGNFQTSSLLKNINIQNDFISKPNNLTKPETKDYIESSIYDPFSSSEEADNRKSMSATDE